MLQWKSYLHTAKACSPRGGASLLKMENGILIFGGANRDQQHFCDLTICRNSTTNNDALLWEICTTTGDIPTARSGHAVCSIGKYMFLFGGIDFTEEVVYNDLYVLNTETLIWQYVGEKGKEITGRNSHSLHVLSIPSINSSIGSISNECDYETNTTKSNPDTNTINYLVLYGGASPEHGPSNDVYYARLPSSSCIDDIGTTGFFVTWLKLNDSASGKTLTGKSVQQPCAREMHSSCAYKNTMIVCGGRIENGNILSDTWCLEGICNNVADSNIVQDDTDNSISFQWRRVEQFDLPLGRCSHSMALISQPSSNNTTKNSYSLCIFGGFTADLKISDELIINQYFASDVIKSNDEATLHNMNNNMINFDTNVAKSDQNNSSNKNHNQNNNSCSNNNDNSSNKNNNQNNSNNNNHINNNHNNSNNNNNSNINIWKTVNFSAPIQERFSSCMCIAPDWFITQTILKQNDHKTGNTTMSSLTSSSSSSSPSSSSSSPPQRQKVSDADVNGLILFGGVNAQCDLADIWLLIEPSSS